MPDPVTPIVGFTLAAPHEAPWDVLTNNNWTLADTYFGRAIITNPGAAQTIAQPGSTRFSFNNGQVYGSLPSLAFGVAAASFSAGISMPSAGVLSVDLSSPGDGLGELSAGVVNAKNGFQYNGAAPLNHFLVGNGTEYVDSATLPVGLLFYQRVQAASINQNQRGILNFLAAFAITDNPGNGSTDVGLANTGVAPGTYTLTTLTVGSDGRITSATSGTPSTYNPIAHDVTGSRTLSTIYQNTNGGVMNVIGYAVTAGSTVASTEIRIGATTPPTLSVWGNTDGATVTNGACAFMAMVPNGWYYEVLPNTLTNSMGSGTTGITKWIEFF